jgi:hypothetical protein
VKGVERNLVLGALLLLSCALGMHMKRPMSDTRQTAFRDRWWRQNAVRGRKKGWAVPEEYDHC